MVGLSEDVVREGWTGHYPGHPEPHQVVGPFYVPARSREYVTATLNAVTFSTQGHAPTHSEALPTPTAPPNPRDPSLALYLPTTALSLLSHLLLPRLLSPTEIRVKETGTSSPLSLKLSFLPSTPRVETLSLHFQLC